MFRGIINAPLRNVEGAFAKIVDGLLSAVPKILTIFEKSPISDILPDFEFVSVCF